MRIALLSHAPALGGSTDLFVQVRDFFQERGHVVQSIFGMGANPMDPRVQDGWIFKSSAGSWREKMRDYVQLVEGFRPDIAYALGGHDEMDLFRFLRCVRIRHVSSLEQHGFADIPYWLSENRAYFEACTANTPDTLAEVERYSGRPTFLLPYRLAPMDSSYGKIEIPANFEKNRPVEVAFVSRLERFQKRAHWLPEIIRHCHALGLGLKWHIYGDGPEGPALRRRLEQTTNVTFHGWTNQAKLYQMLPQHDLLFFCSRWEGLPISMVEAMRCGLACVAPDIPAGIHWTLSHGGGWLYQATSPRAAAIALTTATRDRNLLLEKRREALRLSAELFSPSLVEEYYPRMEASFQHLTFNGQALDVATAPKFRPVRFQAYFEQMVYGMDKFRRSPKWLLTKIGERLRFAR